MNLATILSKEQYEAVEIFFHENYGKKAGLLRSDYKVHFDDEIKNDVIVYSGEVLKICFKDNPIESGRWKFFANDLFVKKASKLKDMLRVPLTKRDKNQIIEMGISQEDASNEKIKKSDEISRFEITAYAVVRVKDKTNGKVVELKVRGDMFTTQEAAIDLLKGGM